MAALLESLRQALASRYRVERELGAGGWAVVFLAEDLRHRRQVALKVLRPELAAEIGAERFTREIETAARLSHPHILPLLDSGSAGSLLYYAMPYVEGESLRARLTREQQLPLEDALQIAREVADALSYAHGRGVVHRDIKPDNILLQSGHAVVADFGIARAIAAAGADTRTATMTVAGTMLGTPSYMSPEQAAGAREVDGRSDVYSLGCVLYEMLAGQPPFTGPTVQSLLHQHLSAEALSVTSIRPAVPSVVAAAIRRALAKTPADRYGTVGLFADALAGGESSATETTRTIESPPATRRGRQLAWLASIGVVIGVGVWLALRPKPEPPAPAPPAHARSEIAVLPFQNLSADGAQAYFALGLHDELLTQLSKVAALKVISRTSVMGYQGTSKSLTTIAGELGVGSVVEGSVQVAGGRLRVNVQLIDAATDEHLWAESYDRTLDDAFAIQSEVAQAIVMAVGAALSSAEQGSLTEAPTANAEAYRLYLQGREYGNRPGFVRSNIEIAQRFYERALALDPDFALAHAALSEVHGIMFAFQFDQSSSRTAIQRAEAMAALRLEPDLPHAHFAMGLAHYWGRRDYRAALEEFAIALKRSPGDAHIWGMVGAVERRLGHWNEALAAYERSAVLDPRSANLHFATGALTYKAMHRYPEAVRAYDRAISLAPDLHVAAAFRGWAYVLWKGQLDTLRAALNRMPKDAELARLGTAAAQRAELLLWERDADGLLRLIRSERDPAFEGAGQAFHPRALYSAWAQQLRGDPAAAQASFDSALARVDAALRVFPDDTRMHAARGLALAGLGRREEALREARWLKQSEAYREDSFSGPLLEADRARIFAQLGDVDAAVDELVRPLTGPSDISFHTLRLDPRFDPIREHPRFKALLVKHGAQTAL